MHHYIHTAKFNPIFGSTQQQQIGAVQYTYTMYMYNSHLKPPFAYFLLRHKCRHTHTAKAFYTRVHIHAHTHTHTHIHTHTLAHIYTHTNMQVLKSDNVSPEVL